MLGAGDLGQGPLPLETTRHPAVRGSQRAFEPRSWLHVSSLLCKAGETRAFLC